MEQTVDAWRREQRASLIAARKSMSSDDRRRAAAAIGAKLDLLCGRIGPLVVGVYWPINNEMNLLDWARALGERGVTLALPVVVTPKAPLEYWRWNPDEKTKPGFWNIPAPARRDVVTPDLVLAPVVGFDAAKYRLGYGGGYFDRTLAAMEQRPVAIGVGYDFSALETIFPLPHDIPMDAILTETREILPSAWV